MKAYRGSRCVAPLIHNLNARYGGWVTSSRDRLTRRKTKTVPNAQEAGWTPGPVWTVLSTDKCRYPSGVPTLYSAVCNLIAISTTPTRHFRLRVMRACARVCVRACVRARVLWVCVRVFCGCACARAHVCARVCV